MIACGTIVSLRDGFAEAVLPPLPIGSHVDIAGTVRGTIVEVSGHRTLIAVHGETPISPGAAVKEVAHPASVAGTALLGRAVNSQLEPIDGKPLPSGRAIRTQSAYSRSRVAIEHRFETGVRVIDAALTIGRGARLGIFGAPGCGKSTLLESIVAGTSADAIVVGLVGERGREAQQWIGRCDERTTVVCETSDRDAAARVRAANLAFLQAEKLADCGLHVLLVLDSLARVAYAMREVAVNYGQPVGRGGYPATTFAQLARLVERAGAFERGSITLLATVLSDGDDRDPVSESARSLLDGHLALSRELAQSGRFPAIDVLGSASRTMAAVVSERHASAAATLRGALAALDGIRDLRTLGIEPTDPGLQRCIRLEPQIEKFLRQGPAPVPFSASLEQLVQMADMLEEPHEYRL